MSSSRSRCPWSTNAFPLERSSPALSSHERAFGIRWKYFWEACFWMVGKYFTTPTTYQFLLVSVWIKGQFWSAAPVTTLSTPLVMSLSNIGVCREYHMWEVNFHLRTLPGPKHELPMAQFPDKFIQTLPVQNSQKRVLLPWPVRSAEPGRNSVSLFG